MTSIATIGLNRAIVNKLGSSTIASMEDVKCLSSAELFELVLRLALFNMRPVWWNEYCPPITLDQRSAKELTREKFTQLTAPYTRDEMWQLLRVIASLEDGKIKWVARATPGGGIELWRR